LLQLSFLAELLADTTPEREPSDALFRLALLVLPHLTQPATADLAQLYFEVWYLKLAGLYPAHRHCYQCQATLGEDEAVFVGVGRHLFACGRCQSGSRRVSLGALTLLDAIGRSHLANLFRTGFSSEAVLELRAIVEFLLQQGFERSFQSLKLIRPQA
jgi:DNA repair protein RecO